MIAYTELVNGVAANLQIDAAGDDISRLQVAENLNRAQLTLLTVLPVFWLDNAVKTARSKLISGRSDYRFPSDFLRFVACGWIMSSRFRTAIPEGKRRFLTKAWDFT